MTAPAEITAPAPVGAASHAARRPRWHLPVAVGAVVGLATAYVAWQDPNGDGAYPLCPTHSLLGIDCPGCGGLRATHALVHGDVAAAVDHNVLVGLLLPVAAVLWVLWLLRSLGVRTPDLPTIPGRAWWAVGIVVLVFTVARNLPGGGVFEYLAATA